LLRIYESLAASETNEVTVEAIGGDAVTLMLRLVSKVWAHNYRPVTFCSETVKMNGRYALLCKVTISSDKTRQASRLLSPNVPAPPHFNIVPSRDRPVGEQVQALKTLLDNRASDDRVTIFAYGNQLGLALIVFHRIAFSGPYKIRLCESDKGTQIYILLSTALPAHT